MFEAILVLLAGQVYADPNQLARIDKSFVCPEHLRTERAKIEALARFDAAANEAILHMTLDQLGELRMIELRRHRCTVTLRNLQTNGVR